MLKRSRAAAAGTAAALLLLFACDRPGGDAIMADFEVIPSATVPIDMGPAPKGAAHEAQSTHAASSGSAAPAVSGSAASAASGAASAAASGSAAGSAAAAKPARVWDCGDKGKPDCPMQKWMKGVAGGAVASGDTERLARAFLAMSKAPPGFGGWGAIAAAGAAKAQAGDFDAAKAQCKVCHQKYQSAYHSTMRDLKWP